MSYLPNTTDSGRSTWKTNAQIKQASPMQRMQAISSGSSRNLSRGWSGAPEVAPGGFNAAANTLIGHYTRRTLFSVADDMVDKELDKHGFNGTPSLGMPDVDAMRNPPSQRVKAEQAQLALNAGPRPMHDRASGPQLALPAAGQTTNNDRPQLALPAVGNTSNARSWVQPTKVTPMGRVAPLAIGPAGNAGNRRGSQGPREWVQGQGRPTTPLNRPMGSRATSSGGTPDARTAVGPGRGPAPAMPTDPAFGPNRGRRAPAGMDPRKRGTWLNYQ